MYGSELILDLHECDASKFNRVNIQIFFTKLCELIGMKSEDLHFWDYEGNQEEYEKAPAHLKGTSAVQFIRTSNITIHTLDILKNVYLNIFSCKSFNHYDVMDFCKEFFNGKIVNYQVLPRK